MKMYRILLLIFLVQIQFNGFSQTPIYGTNDVHHPVRGEKGMVATQHYLGTQVGTDILKAGGNAIDAAVAVGFSLAVVLPRAGNLGGGGFMLLHNKKDQSTRAINYRECAPAAATEKMYLDENDQVIDNLYNKSYLSIGVPGTVAGLIYALEKYGTMSIKDVIKPAIKLAEDGFPISHDLASLIQKYEERLSKSKDSKNIFFPPNGYYKPTHILKQPDLAKSLKQICKHGHAAFYQGDIMKKIVADVQANGGILTEKDFQNYQVKETDAVHGEYRGFKIASMPPPSSGGVHIVQMLNILEGFDIKNTGHNTAATIHLMAEAMRLAYADRSKHLGDPEFWNVPTKGLSSKAYANSLRELIKIDTVNSSKEILPGTPQDYESEETTHFSIADQYGNVVSNTYTLNFSFGTGLVAKGTGILLNNEMGDFAAKEGYVDAYGLVGGKANIIEPKKRPLSSMTPTIVFKDDVPFLITGSPGGSRIITTVLQIIMNVIDHDMNIAEATHAPRIHHQWYPDKLFYESSLNADTRKLLERKGHSTQQRATMGSTHSILIEGGWFYGSSDPRRPDGKTIGF